MTNIALKLNFSDSSKKGKSSIEKVKNTHTEELFIGICSPIGSHKENVIKELKKILKNTYKYEVKTIKLSSYIDKYKTDSYNCIEGKTEEYSKLIYKIQEGDKLRKKYSNNSILVELGILDIHNERTSEISEDENLPESESYSSRRVCYIIDSIKNREELLLLREVYTDLFYCFSIFSPFHEREENLRSKNLSSSEIESIINTDEFENNSFGQNVRNTFTEGDFFLRISEDNKKLLQKKISRYLHLIFDTDIVTPSVDENAMYHAKSVAGNSSCLSRQVGATITDKFGLVLSKGWNDVPKFGGNLYQEGDLLDRRCKTLGYCSNDYQKDLLVDAISDFIKSDNSLNKIFKSPDGSFDLEVMNAFKIKMRDSKIKDLLEFSRSVHAEMHAIITGSQISGSQMIGGKLYCTTYPCHNCARHIIVAGIKEIYYIEPYIKSLCLKLHDDAITDNEQEENKVRILMYDGVSPRRYLSFFSNFTERKDKKGALIKRDCGIAFPKMSKTLQALPTLERQAIHSLNDCGILED